MADIDFNENDIMEKIEEINGYRSDIVSSLRSKNVDLDVDDGLSSIAFKLGQADDYIIKASDQQFGAVKTFSLSAGTNGIVAVDNNDNIIDVDNQDSFVVNAESLIDQLDAIDDKLDTQINTIASDLETLSTTYNTFVTSKSVTDALGLVTKFTSIEASITGLQQAIGNIQFQIAGIKNYLSIDVNDFGEVTPWSEKTEQTEIEEPANIEE